MDVLQQHAARQQQRGHHPRERRDLGEVRGIDGEAAARAWSAERSRGSTRAAIWTPSKRSSQPADGGRGVGAGIVDRADRSSRPQHPGATRAMVSSSSAVWYKWSSTDTTWRRSKPGGGDDMRTTLPPARARRVGLLYAGRRRVRAAGGADGAQRLAAWQERAGQARTAAVFELVQQRMPSRPIEAPGAIAWLREQIVAYRRTSPPSDALTFERLADETDRMSRTSSCPRRTRCAPSSPPRRHEVPMPVADIAGAGRSLAAVALAADRARRDVRGDPPPRARADAGSNRFVAAAAGRRWPRPRPHAGRRAARRRAAGAAVRAGRGRHAGLAALAAHHRDRRRRRPKRGAAAVVAADAAVLRPRGVLLPLRRRRAGCPFATPASTSISAVAGSCPR